MATRKNFSGNPDITQTSLHNLKPNRTGHGQLAKPAGLRKFNRLIILPIGTLLVMPVPGGTLSSRHNVFGS